MKAEVHHLDPQRSPTPLQLTSAATPWARFRGLLGMNSLPHSQGLWIRPCNSVHCFFMRFAIDVLYLDAEQHILHIRHRLRPWGLSAHWSAHSVVELAAGECRRLQIEPGDRLQCAP